MLILLALHSQTVFRILPRNRLIIHLQEPKWKNLPITVSFGREYFTPCPANGTQPTYWSSDCKCKKLRLEFIVIQELNQYAYGPFRTEPIW
jgi:hypothetical protein